MNSDDGCLGLVLLALMASIVLSAIVVRMSGRDAAHDEFLECRTLLATSDSATVHRTMPQCHKWTLPPRDAAKGEG